MHKKEHTSKGSPFLDAVCRRPYQPPPFDRSRGGLQEASSALLSGNFPMGLICANEVLENIPGRGCIRAALSLLVRLGNL